MVPMKVEVREYVLEGVFVSWNETNINKKSEPGKKNTLYRRLVRVNTMLPMSHSSSDFSLSSLIHMSGTAIERR